LTELRQKVVCSAVTLSLRAEQDADDGELALDGR